MRKAILIIISIFVIVGGAITAFLLMNKEAPVEFTPIENRAYTDNELTVISV